MEEEAEDSFPHAKVRDLELLAESLAGRPELADETIADWLSFDFDRENDSGHYRAGAGILLAGHRRPTAVVDRLVDMLEYDWDWWNENCADALGGMDDEAALDHILDCYPDLEWDQRLFVTSALERLRISTRCERVISLTREEEETDLQKKCCLKAPVTG